jgi:hypothetical protein
MARKPAVQAHTSPNKLCSVSIENPMSDIYGAEHFPSNRILNLTYLKWRFLRKHLNIFIFRAGASGVQPTLNQVIIHELRHFSSE